MIESGFPIPTASRAIVASGSLGRGHAQPGRLAGSLGRARRRTSPVEGDQAGDGLPPRWPVREHGVRGVALR
jgi:hypothetical protein